MVNKWTYEEYMKEVRRLNSKAYYKYNREQVLERVKKYNQEHKEELNMKRNLPESKIRKKELDRIFNAKPKVKVRRNMREKERKKKDMNYNIKCKLRTRFWMILKKYTKTGKIMSSRQYGINYEEIIDFLKPFPKNLKDYEIHHIKPLNTFNFIKEEDTINSEEIRKAFAPKNHKLVTKEEHKKIHGKKKTNHNHQEV